MLALSLQKSLRLLFECPGFRSFRVQGEDFVDRAKGRVICALIQRLLRAIESGGNALLALADRSNLFDGLSHFPAKVGCPVYVRKRGRGFLGERSGFVQVAVGNQSVCFIEQLANGLPFNGKPGLVDQVDRLTAIRIDGRGALSVVQRSVMLAARECLFAEAQMFFDLLAPEFREAFR